MHLDDQTGTDAFERLRIFFGKSESEGYCISRRARIEGAKANSPNEDPPIHDLTIEALFGLGGSGEGLVKPGEPVAILGGGGAGKTMLRAELWFRLHEHSRWDSNCPIPVLLDMKEIVKCDCRGGLSALAPSFSHIGLQNSDRFNGKPFQFTPNLVFLVDGVDEVPSDKLSKWLEDNNGAGTPLLRSADCYTEHRWVFFCRESRLHADGTSIGRWLHRSEGRDCLFHTLLYLEDIQPFERRQFLRDLLPDARSESARAFMESAALESAAKNGLLLHLLMLDLAGVPNEWPSSAIEEAARLGRTLNLGLILDSVLMRLVARQYDNAENPGRQTLREVLMLEKFRDARPRKLPTTPDPEASWKVYWELYLLGIVAASLNQLGPSHGNFTPEDIEDCLRCFLESDTSKGRFPDIWPTRENQDEEEIPVGYKLDRTIDERFIKSLASGSVRSPLLLRSGENCYSWLHARLGDWAAAFVLRHGTNQDSVAPEKYLDRMIQTEQDREIEPGHERWAVLDFITDVMDSGSLKQLVDRLWKDRTAPFAIDRLAQFLNELLTNKTADKREILDRLVEIYADYDYLSARLKNGGMQELLADCKQSALLAERLPAPDDEMGQRIAQLQTISQFLDLSAHTIGRDCGQLPYQIIARLGEEDSHPIAHLREHAQEAIDRLAIKPIQFHLRAPGGPLIRRLTGHSVGVDGFWLHPSGLHGISWSWNGIYRIWDLETGECQREFKGHWGSPVGFLLHPNGQHGISWSSDETLRIWDLETGECLRLIEGHSDGIKGFLLRLNHLQGISWSEDKTLRIWDLGTGKCLRLLEGHSESVDGFLLYPDGQCGISWSGDRTLRIWDLETGECLHILNGHSGAVNGFLFYPGGQYGISWSDDKTLIVWDLETNERLHVLEGHSGPVEGFLLHPDGWRGISWSRDRTPRIWNLDTGKCLRVLNGHSRAVNGFLFYPGGHYGIFWSDDKTLIVWDLESGERLHVLEGHSGPVEGFLLHPDGWRGISWSRDRTPRIWNLDTGKCLRVLNGHSGAVNGFILHPDGWRGISWSQDSSLLIWDMEQHNVDRSPVCRHSSGVSNLIVCSNGRCGISWSRGCYDWESAPSLRVWDLETGNCLRVLDGHSGAVEGFLLNPDKDQRGISWSRDHTVRIWDLDTGECLHVLEGHSGAVEGFLLNPNKDRRGISWSNDKALRIWNMGTGDCLHVLEGHSDGIKGFLLHHDGQRGISWSAGWQSDHSPRIWDLETGQCLHVFEGHSERINAFLLHHDGQRGISWSNDKTLRIWDLGTGDCLHVLEGHSRGINGFLLHHDGQRGISWSAGWWQSDHSPRIWDLETGQCLHVLEGHSRGINGFLLHHDGQRGISWSNDKTLRIWNMETGECLHVLEGHSGGVRGFYCHYDNRHGISWSLDHTPRIWDLETGKCLHVLEGHSGWVEGFLLHPNSRNGITWALDGSVALWNLDQGACLGGFIADSNITDVAIEPEQNVLMVGDAEGRVHFFRLHLPDTVAKDPATPIKEEK